MALLNQPPIGAVVNPDGTATPGWSPFFSAIFALLTAMTQSGTTAQRPTTLLWVGRPYLDTTIGKPIWLKSTGPTVWIDATGAAV